MRIVTEKQYEELMQWANSLQVVKDHDSIILQDQLNEQKGKRWTAEAKLIKERDISRKLNNVILSAYQHMLGNGSEQAEKDMLEQLYSTLNEYSIHLNENKGER